MRRTRSPQKKKALSYAMDRMTRRYRYVGPTDLRDLPHAVDSVDAISVRTLDRWLASQTRRDLEAPFTYIITVEEILRVAPRRREHVACARSHDVLGAGEIQFEADGPDWIVTEISNQSTGYCPDVTSWAAVAAALDRAGLRHPDGFTQPIIFRACVACFAINIIRDDDYVCAICRETLPSEWNIGESRPSDSKGT